MTRLAQHFLTSRSIARKMVEAAEADKNDVVLEIGPGKGILTEELLKTGAEVIAIEKDINLFNFLQQKFATFKPLNHLTLLNADIRDYLKTQNVSVRHRVFNKVVANIPYYLTGQLLRLLLSQTKFGPEKMVLMLQKEVAIRIFGQPPALSKSGQRRGLSKLAISVQVFAKPRIAFYVPKKYFLPQPKVDSAVIVLERRSKDFFHEHKISQKDFFNLVKTGFRHPRKLLKNNLKKCLEANEAKKLKSFQRCGIAEKSRAEDLSLENWVCLAKNTAVDIL